MNKSHGRSKTPEYRTWIQMLVRCRNVKYKSYHRYGGRGIKVCDQWANDFMTFLKDVGPKPSSKHTLDRIDSNGDYEPGNIQWATQKQQHNNRTDNRIVTVEGVPMTVAEAAEKYNVPHVRIRNRLNYGWAGEAAVLIPLQGRRLDKIIK